MGTLSKLGTSKASRAQIETLVQSLIDWLDMHDGDPDLECCDTEEDFVLSPYALCVTNRQIGCNISEPDIAAEELGCDDDGYGEAEAHTIRGGLN